MDIFSLKDVCFTYPDAKEKALNQIHLQIKEGDFTVIAGPSGCGKTTLLRLLKKELSPVGTKTGDIYYAGKLLHEWEERTLIEEIGFVFQNPDHQIVMDEVMQEIVFGLENLGYSTVEMRKRVAELVHFFGLEALLYEKPTNLSGGQKQMVNLLSVLLLKPKVLLLDEPTSQLDPVTANDLLGMLVRLNEEMGMTIVIVEHRLEQLFSVADQVIILDEGEIRYNHSSKMVMKEIYNKKDENFFSYLPSISQLFLQREKNIVAKHIPVTVKEGRVWLQGLPLRKRELEIPEKPFQRSDNLMIQAKNIFFQYKKSDELVLQNFSLDIYEGDFYALIGGNGSGKTTALKVFLGLEKAQRGSLRMLQERVNKKSLEQLYDHIAYLPQNPQAFFSYDTVKEEMVSAVEKYNISNGEQKITEMIQLFGIEHLLDRHPYDCSGGEMQKIALATMLLKKPKILFLDEPTKGFDPLSKRDFARYLSKLHKEGLTIVMVTHDIEFAARYATMCGMLFQGEITAEGTPEELFHGNYFYTTSISRMTRNQPIPEALTLEEALLKWPTEMSADQTLS